MGRPLKVIDWKTVVNLCELQCTGEEIASVIEVDYDTLNTACKREHGKSFSDYFEEKRAGGKVSLRRAQFKTATEDGNPTMLIWLGKQMLGQRDKLDVDQRSSDRSMSPVKELSDEELAKRFRELGLELPKID